MNQTPVDYLESIAPKQHRKSLFELSLRNIILLGGIGVLLIIIVAVISNSIAAQSAAHWHTLSSKLTYTETVAADASSLIKNSQLRSLNSEVKVAIVNTKRDLETPFSNVGITAKNTPSSIQKAETASQEKMALSLETARLNAKYDSTYAREMSYQLSSILALYQQLYSKSSSQTQKVLETAYDNLLPTQKAIASFSDSNE